MTVENIKPLQVSCQLTKLSTTGNDGRSYLDLVDTVGSTIETDLFVTKLGTREFLGRQKTVIYLPSIQLEGMSSLEENLSDGFVKVTRYNIQDVMNELIADTTNFCTQFKFAKAQNINITGPFLLHETTLKNEDGSEETCKFISFKESDALIKAIHSLCSFETDFRGTQRNARGANGESIAVEKCD